MRSFAMCIGLVLSALALVYNRAVASYFVENNTTPFTFLRPQDRIPREDRLEKLQEFREARSFWLPIMRGFVVLMALGFLVIFGAGLAQALL